MSMLSMDLLVCECVCYVLNEFVFDYFFWYFFNNFSSNRWICTNQNLRREENLHRFKFAFLSLCVCVCHTCWLPPIRTEKRYWNYVGSYLRVSFRNWALWILFKVIVWDKILLNRHGSLLLTKFYMEIFMYFICCTNSYWYTQNLWVIH